jgi:dTDP-L-rhamnose 4-epimerase
VHDGIKEIVLPPSVRLFTGDVTHAPSWDAVLRLFRPSQIVHLAAQTGTGQSLSHATRHGSVNVVGTAQLLDALSRSAFVPNQLVLASSRAVYGEGAWRSGTQTIYPRPRSDAQLLAGIWDPQAHRRTCGPACQLRRPDRAAAYQHLCCDEACAGAHAVAWTAAHDTRLSVLRLQNVYGMSTGQASR